MPNIKSAKKRMRQNEKRRTHNKGIKSAVKTQLKKFEEQIKETKSEDEAKKILATTVSVLDKAQQKGILHKNYVGRKKSSIYAKFTAAIKSD